MAPSGARSRLISGIALIAVAIGWGVVEANKLAGQSRRDFAVCGSAVSPLECQTEQRPMTVMWTRSSANGFQKLYEGDVQTGRHTTMFLDGLTETDVWPLAGLTSIYVL